LVFFDLIHFDFRAGSPLDRAKLRFISALYMTVQYGQFKVVRMASLPARRVLALSSLATLLMSTACATLPAATTAPDAKPASAYASSQAFKASDAAWPGEGWWKAYGDAQLTGLIDEALAGSPDLAQAEARLRRADASAAQAQAADRPNLGFRASASETKQSYNGLIPGAFLPQGFNDYGNVGFNFAWDLDFWGKNRAAIAAATSDAQAAKAEAAQARLMLASSVAAAYADLGRLYAERDVTSRAVALRGETVSLVQSRVTNGLDTQGELRQAQAGPPAARAELAALDEQIAQTRNRIAALLGAGPDRGLSVTPPKGAALKPFGLPATLSADLVGRRPDVAAARWRAEAASTRVGQARTAFYPNINLSAGVGLDVLHLNKLFDAGSDTQNVGPAISLPIFDGGRLRANLRGAEAERDAAVAAYNATVVNALHDVADVAASERALASRLSESHAALAASEDGYSIAKLRYQGGLSTYQNVLVAEETVLTQRRIVADLDSRALVLDVNLVRALGGGLSSS
jgi:NodT family efflux transporter outer membrane factor (OMF) lipoprotein